MRPEVAKYKRELRQHTGIDWEFKDGQMVSAPTARMLAERIIERDSLPAMMSPASTPINAQLSLTLENTEAYLERMNAERGKGV